MQPAATGVQSVHRQLTGDEKMLDTRLKEEALRLRNEEHLTYGEISGILNIRRNTVKSWMHRAASDINSDTSSKGVTMCYTQRNQGVSRSFTEEERRLLSQSPYVRIVTETAIYFSKTFSEDYWKRYRDGEEPNEILSSMGIDPELLGEARRVSLHKRICKTFSDIDPSIGNKCDSTECIVSKKALAKMEHELAYLRQEVEFIKKILSQGKEKEL